MFKDLRQGVGIRTEKVDWVPLQFEIIVEKSMADASDLGMTHLVSCFNFRVKRGVTEGGHNPK